MCIGFSCVLTAEADGIVEFVDANEIHIRYDLNEDQRLVRFDDEIVVYKLTKFRRTNQDTCINIRPLVKRNDRIKKGDVLVDGYATEKGELALGRNLLVAFMPWQGYNFEDAIVISERVVRDDIFTSLHIVEYDLEVRDTKRGAEELTSEIPNVSEEAVKNLDENGIIRVGAEIKEGDILIGKITPKGESDPTPEEKLLRAIFGDKAGDVKDASLRVSPSTRGVIIDTKLFSRPKKDKDMRARAKREVENLKKKFSRDLKDIQEVCLSKMVHMLDGELCQGIKHKFGEEIMSKGVKFNAANITETYSQLKICSVMRVDMPLMRKQTYLATYHLKAGQTMSTQIA